MVLLKKWQDLRDWFIEEGYYSESNNYPDGKILNMRKIAVVTGTRAEYGLLYWIIKGIHEDTELQETI